MEQKRSFTKTAGILNVVCGSLTIFSAIYLSALAVQTDYLSSIIALLVGMLFLGIAILTLSIILLIKAAPSKKYPKGIAITLFVFDVLMALDYLYSLFNPNNTSNAFVVLLLIVTYALSASFLMFDVVKCKSEKQSEQLPQQEQPKSDTSSSDNLEKELEKLKIMLENGTITQEEYNQLKSKLIERY